MANGKGEGGALSRLDPRRVLHATIAGIQLTSEQTAQIREASGADVEWLLFHHISGSLARDIDASHVSQVKLTWAW